MIFKWPPDNLPEPTDVGNEGGESRGQREVSRVPVGMIGRIERVRRMVGFGAALQAKGRMFFNFKLHLSPALSPIYSNDGEGVTWVRDWVMVGMIGRLGWIGRMSQFRSSCSLLEPKTRLTSKSIFCRSSRFSCCTADRACRHCASCSASSVSRGVIGCINRRFHAKKVQTFYGFFADFFTPRARTTAAAFRRANPPRRSAVPAPAASNSAW